MRAESGWPKLRILSIPSHLIQHEYKACPGIIQLTSCVRIALVAFAAPAFVGPAASVVLDELTVPSSAPQVMAPPASLEQLPKVSPPVEPVRQAPTLLNTPEESDNATPGEPAAPPPPKRRLSRLQELQQVVFPISFICIARLFHTPFLLCRGKLRLYLSSIPLRDTAHKSTHGAVPEARRMHLQ